MSKRINVNPNFYQVAGREHTDGPDNGTPRAGEKQMMASSQKGKGTKVVAEKRKGSRQSDG